MSIYVVEFPLSMREYLKLLKFVKPHIPILLLAALCMGVSTLLNGVSLGMIVPLSDRVLTNKDIVVPAKLPPFLMELIGKLNDIPPYTILKGMAVVVLFLFLAKGIAMFMQNYLMSIVGQACIRDVRNKIYAKLHDLPLDFYAQKRTGELISRITTDVMFITQAISYGLTDLIYQSMQVVLFTFLVFFIYWKLAFISLVLFPLIMLPVIKISKRIKRDTFEVQRRMADLNSLLSETIQGAYIVKAFCREKYENQRFEKINMQYYKYMIKTIKRTLMLSPFTEFVGSVAAIGILLVAGKEVIDGKLSFGVFGLFLGSLMSLIKPFKKLSNVHSINQQAISASSRIYEVLEEKNPIQEKPGAFELKKFDNEILFDNVSFRYGESEEEALSGVNLRVKRHEVIALVGHSGAGKSTFVNLIPRFYDVDEGRICIDGIDVRDVVLKPLRELISIVSQEMILFNGTIRENIAYGRLDADFDDIVDAAKKAHAYEFISKFPDQFETKMGDRGVRLSGGEKQRISIARAILKQAPILILDEATSHLDSESESLIRDAFDNLMKGKTVFVIAHRLATVQNADRIVVLHRGRIIEEGTHVQLLESSTTYKKLYELQFRA